MITQIFKKTQESSAQFCTCSLTSTGIAKSQKGEKFLVRLQTQPSEGNIQVNRPKVIGLKKEKQLKLSLKIKEKKRENIQTQAPVIQRDTYSNIKVEKETNFDFKFYQPVIVNHEQHIQTSQKNKKQRKQFFLLKQMYPRQELKQIKIDNNIQRYEKPFTQKSTYFSNATQVKNSIQILPLKINTKYLGNNKTSISAIEQTETSEESWLPRSKSFSTNLIRNNTKGEFFSFEIEKNQTANNNLNIQETDQKINQTQFKLNDLRFKSAESFQQAQNDQYSELASENQYLSHPNINQESWSHSLNQIFVKKMRRLSHNPDA